jgi:hypothetical protein
MSEREIQELAKAGHVPGGDDDDDLDEESATSELLGSYAPTPQRAIEGGAGSGMT